jgi:transcriptional regulator with XRE-family HTH domain
MARDGKQSAGESPLKVFGQMLTFFRERAGISPEELGPRVHLSGSTIRKVESGDRVATVDLVTRCETIPDLRLDGALMALFEAMRDYLKNGVYPGWFREWPKKETYARRLRSFSLVVLDGLLQTEDYARAILSAGLGMPEDKLDGAVAGRMARQAILDRDDPPELWFIIDEATLRRRVGGTEIMCAQLRHLAEMARRPNIVVQVIPLAAGAHEGLRGGPFVIAEFDDARDVAYQDTALAGQIIEDEDEVKSLVHAWEVLGLDVLSRADSLALIEEAAQQ